LAGGTPVLIIGGILIDDIPELMEAGAFGLAVSSLVNHSASPGQIMKKLVRLISSAVQYKEGTAV